jgi:hypothetical protein
MLAFMCVVGRFLHNDRLPRRRTRVLKMRSGVMTRAKAGTSPNSASRAHSLSSGTDDGFMNYDSDYEIQDDTPGVPVDIDPYAGLSSSLDFAVRI